MSDYAPVYGRPQQTTLVAGAAITGGQLLSYSAADTVVPSGANPTNYAGIAAHDAASGAPVTVLMGSGVVHETANNSGSTITAAGLVYAGAAGGVTGTVGTGYGAVAIGVAVRTALTTAVLRWKSLVG
jgi:hypothetical protein